MTRRWFMRNAAFLVCRKKDLPYLYRDIIIAINNRLVKKITWEEQRKDLGLKGETIYIIKKANGKIISYTLFIDKQII
ncbi:hypothetical protein [Bacteroides heparinolyticus]|uniref:hypothetical protein n=1 Tax=Prevotella heparinolytica TaxID=28113 RepID=UPI0023F519A8|nr:hypothetical protein [Bacteroides heparinolyticus]